MGARAWTLLLSHFGHLFCLASPLLPGDSLFNWAWACNVRSSEHTPSLILEPYSQRCEVFQTGFLVKRLFSRCTFWQGKPETKKTTNKSRSEWTLSLEVTPTTQGHFSRADRGKCCKTYRRVEEQNSAAVRIPDDTAGRATAGDVEECNRVISCCLPKPVQHRSGFMMPSASPFCCLLLWIVNCGLE